MPWGYGGDLGTGSAFKGFGLVFQGEEVVNTHFLHSGVIVTIKFI